MTTPDSAVLGFPAPEAAESHAYMLAKLRFHADAWDVGEDLKRGITDIVVIDTRSEAHYAEGHVPGAINFPHRLMTEESTRDLDRTKTYVTYCDGIGCNGSTKGAYKLSGHGFKVKEMLGGLDFWIRDGWPLAKGAEPGSMRGEASAIECSC
ncbi:rhodanese-like domain-containing protein [Geothrix sp. PMB-07]|uniref:rhodanese-like domain-containing protein n=1 Tax=Geothrix sp. PMB-07 TaxID=3068640 RepID=UPI0027424214|nr:rhodanese-like domain-containing protein [Geothrix sp. PMB-07]WLT31726.1 rhodanese-like domain-containing protein [Geothrix sp. PMB-07]